MKNSFFNGLKKEICLANLQFEISQLFMRPLYWLYASKKKQSILMIETAIITKSLKSHLKGQRKKYMRNIPKIRPP